MLVNSCLERDFVKARPEASVFEVIEIMKERGSSCGYVVNSKDELVGMITSSIIYGFITDNLSVDITIDQMMIPIKEIRYVYPDTGLKNVMDVFTKYDVKYLPVLESAYSFKMVGFVSHKEILKHYMNWQMQIQMENLQEKRAREILNSLNEGLIVVDKDLIIREFNPAAEILTGLKAVDRIGKRSSNISSKPSITEIVMSTGQARYNVETQMQDGRVFLVNYVPMRHNGSDKVTGVIQTFTDMTKIKTLQVQLSKTKEELDKAFALTLPNSKVEYKLKSTPEYRDEYDSDESTIKITETIEGGGYLHVVNCLKVAADFNEMGLMKLIGINKDTLVEAIIFHDLGKSQPNLKVGDVVTPEEAFEEGIYHAGRSADLADKFYGKDEDVVNIIRYHHHTEEMLPKDFPTHLLPLLRLFKVIDGLSAALTRRSAKVTYKSEGSRLIVFEENKHPKYNRVLELDLYTGRGSEKPLGGKIEDGVN